MGGCWYLYYYHPHKCGCILYDSSPANTQTKERLQSHRDRSTLSEILALDLSVFFCTRTMLCPFQNSWQTLANPGATTSTPSVSLVSFGGVMDSFGARNPCKALSPKRWCTRSPDKPLKSTYLFFAKSKYPHRKYPNLPSLTRVCYRVGRPWS